MIFGHNSYASCNIFLDEKRSQSDENLSEKGWTTYGRGQARNPAIKPITNVPCDHDLCLEVMPPSFLQYKVLPTLPTGIKDSPAPLLIETAQGEFESGSFVLRSSCDLSCVEVWVEQESRSENMNQVLPVNAVYIQGVKTWFQSAETVRRTDSSKKVLVPELILNDLNLVDVDLERQLNRVKNVQHFCDANQFKPFNLKSGANQQILVTVDATIRRPIGTHRFKIRVRGHRDGHIIEASLPLEIRVSSVELPKTPGLACLYYAGLQEPPRDGRYLDVHAKSTLKVKNDLADMVRYGINGLVVMYKSRKNAASPNGRDIDELFRILSVQKKALKLVIFRDLEYEKKHNKRTTNPEIWDVDIPISWVDRIQQLTVKEHFFKTGIYGIDEGSATDQKRRFASLKHAQKIGLETATAIRVKDAQQLVGIFDYVIVHRDKDIRSLQSSGFKVLAYNKPQAGVEDPGLHRERYGFSLWLDGFDGLCNYAYQTGRSSWDDWQAKKWRPHNVTYPGKEKPVQTLQWIGIREAIDDQRYLAAFLKKEGYMGPATRQAREKWLQNAVGVENYPFDHSGRLKSADSLARLRAVLRAKLGKI
jgi:hypothetical protein